MVLHLGHDAVISHRSAAMLWGIGHDDPATVQATVIGRDTVRRPRMETHRVAALDPRDVRLRHGLPTTAPARILVDMAACAGDAELDRMLSEARVLKLVTDAELDAAMARCPLRTGVGPLRALLAAERGAALTRSDAERRLRRLIDQGQLPSPRFNASLGGYEVDALWTLERVAVEVDGYGFHGHRAAFERDRRRDQKLAAEGYVVLRVTWRQLVGEPMAVLVRLAQALARAGGNAIREG